MSGYHRAPNRPPRIDPRDLTPEEYDRLVYAELDDVYDRTKGDPRRVLSRVSDRIREDIGAILEREDRP